MEESEKNEFLYKYLLTFISYLFKVGVISTINPSFKHILIRWWLDKDGSTLILYPAMFQCSGGHFLILTILALLA